MNYALTSTEFTGYIDLEYDQDGLLIGMQIHAELSKEQRMWFVKVLPPTLEELKTILREKKSNARIQEIKFQPTFDDFWMKYDDRTTSSRKRALTKWDRMSRTDQSRAYKYIDRYFQQIPSGTRKKYAETYLNSELWNN